MSAFFVDTSALAKRYLSEPGSRWVLSWILPTSGNVIAVAETAVVEMSSLLNRRRREKALTQSQVSILQANFLLHIETEYLVVPLETTRLLEAHYLTNKHPLRALDAIQLACGLHAVAILKTSMTFITADINLLTIAASEGFTVDNPNSYP